MPKRRRRGRGRRQQTAILLSGKAAWPLALSRPPPLLLLLLLSDENRTGKKYMKKIEREHLDPLVYSSRQAFIFVVCFQPFNFQTVLLNQDNFHCCFLQFTASQTLLLLPFLPLFI